MRRALVTGGSSPIGGAIAFELAGQGLDVTLLANRNIQAAEKTAKLIEAQGGSARAMALNLLEETSFGALADLAETQPFQVFIHAAGGQRDMPFAAMSRSDWQDIVDLNLNSFFAGLRPVIMPMIRSRFGRVIAISSLTAVSGNRGQTNYAAAKGGMLALMKSLSREYGSRGLTANVVAPGLIDTEETRNLANYEELVKLSPLKRAGKAEEVAALVGFLASERAGYISGQLICVDGGSI